MLRLLNKFNPIITLTTEQCKYKITSIKERCR